MRTANVSLRWRLLHRRSTDDKVRKSITDSMHGSEIMNFLLNLSQLEYIIKDLFRIALDQRDKAWTEGKQEAEDKLKELSDYFTGEKALAKVKRDDNLMKWFLNMAAKVNALNLDEDHATATGRKIQGITALAM